MANPRRVLLATPAHDGRCDVEYTHSLCQTIRLCMQMGIDAREVFWPGEALVQRARSELVKIALEGEFSDLVFIDSDQEWKPEWVPQLLRHPVDCVGGAVRLKTDKSELYNLSIKTFALPVDPSTGLLLVDGLGTGFMRLSLRAMRVLWELSEEWLDDFGKVQRWMFDVCIVNRRLVSEDIGMAAKLKSAGIQTYLDPTITCSHIGRKKYTGDFQSWLARAQAQAEAQAQDAKPSNQSKNLQLTA